MLKKQITKIFCVVLFMHSFLYVESRQYDNGAISMFKPQRQDTAKDSQNSIDSLPKLTIPSDSTLIANDTTAIDTTKKKSAFIDNIITSTNKDSLVYDVKNSRMYMYTEGDVKYGENILLADYIEMQMDKDLIYAYGSTDTAGVYKKPEFSQGEQKYNMDTITYNIKSQKAMIKGIVFKEGEGILRGQSIKKVDDNVMNIHGGTYSTCDADHPHFYLSMSKAQLVQGKNSKKVIVGPSYLVLEDVPLPLVLPFGFFPIMSDRNSGVILPEVGEENLKGFYVRGLGYYFVFNDYIDLAVRGGMYTLGSWETSVGSTYKKRYQFNGSFSVNFSKDILGEKGATDYRNMNNYRIMWTHSQDPKFKPGSTFSANVNFASSKFNKYDATNMNDYVSSQTNSSITYSKRWAGTPLSFSTNLQQSMNNRDSTVMLSMPNFVFNMSRIFPFRRKNAVGKQRWYEKISLNYTGTFNNSVTTKQDKLFSEEMFNNMKYGMKHEVPVGTSFNILKYLNISPNANYTERWYFSRIDKQWNPELNRTVISDTTKGFYRVFDYRFSVGLSTRIYGMANFRGNDPPIKAIRHVMTPSISFGYTPNFGAEKFGYYRPVQIDSTGRMGTYSPYEQGIYGLPGQNESASMSFSLGNTLEMKVRSKTDTTGVKKVKILESLNISSSYNFIADSMNLSPFSLTARTTIFKSLGININATLDPYAVDGRGRKINTFLWQDKRKLVRLTNLNFSFGYSFRSVFGLEKGTGSDALAPAPSADQQNFFAQNNINALQQQQMMSMRYYDFSVPWNLSFTYNFSYSNSGLVGNLSQTLGFNGSINLTPKMGLTFNGGYDFKTRKITPGTINLTRDLHCWQMTFSWVPIGFRKSWNFTIRVKAGMLSDLKYKKSSSYLDNGYSNYY